VQKNRKTQRKFILFLNILLIVSLCLFVLSACSEENGKTTSDAADEKSQIEKTANSEKQTAPDQKEKESSGESDTDKTGSSERTKVKKNQTESNSSGNSGKTWVEPVYKTVKHPAQTHQEEYVDYYTCQCGRTFSNTAEWQNHRPNPCNGKHTFAKPHWVTKTVVDKPAWTEKVLVKEGYWK